MVIIANRIGVMPVGKADPIAIIKCQNALRTAQFSNLTLPTIATDVASGLRWQET